MSSEGQQPQTRAEHHADSDPTQVRDSRKTVRRLLEEYAVGRENATPGSVLADRVPLKATTVRDIIGELRDDPMGPPIGQCSDGYYVISSETELDEWVGGVKEEISTKKERLRANVSSFNRRNRDP